MSETYFIGEVIMIIFILPFFAS